MRADPAETTRGIRLQPLALSPTLKDHIHDALRAAIMAMDIYAEGADLRLDERDLAAQLGVSRTPLREALARLQADGFVDIVPRRGVFVRRKSLSEVLEMVILWAALESMAARLATERASDADLRALRDFAQRAGAGAGLADYSDANIAFHQRILALSHCTLLARTADDMFVHMHAVRRRAMGEGDRLHRSRTEHLEIVDALQARDAARAERLVREHTLRLHDHIRHSWPDPDRQPTHKGA